MSTQRYPNQARVLLVLVSLAGCVTSGAQGKPQVDSVHPPRLTPRSVLFADASRCHPRLSADGRRIAFIAPHQGVGNIWLADVATLTKAKPLTRETKGGILRFWWAGTGEHLLFERDPSGGEKRHLICLELASGKRNASMTRTSSSGIPTVNASDSMA